VNTDNNHAHSTDSMRKVKNHWLIWYKLGEKIGDARNDINLMYGTMGSHERQPVFSISDNARAIKLTNLSWSSINCTPSKKLNKIPWAGLLARPDILALQRTS
jgi:hypothetical protein